jgi:oxygen-independent coproporphyrinogen-3 oxidase
VGDAAVDTVFVGGGTPSLLGAERLGAVLGAVRSTFGLAPARR